MRLGAISFDPRPREGATGVPQPRCRGSFDPRPREGGDPGRPSARCFDPRPREGGDTGQRTGGNTAVSIHAPAKGATAGGRSLTHRCVSIHAPVKGATDRSGGSVDASFDPRPREGGDAALARISPVQFRSTPPRKGRRQPWSPEEGAFRSTPPRRGRPLRRGRLSSTTCFDPRPREGGDSVAGSQLARPASFDPRPREGGDPAPSGAHRQPVSIHAPAKGATPRPRRKRRRAFRSTPPRRGRPLGLGTMLPFSVSIHAPAKGATHGTSSDLRPIEFRSTPPRRGRPAPAPGRDLTALFRSTPPRRGRPGADGLCVSPQVSIHAPAKGATPRRRFADRPRCFDPRPREGGDAEPTRRSYVKACFDPRPREGGDRPRPRRFHRRHVSSTPPRRGRLTRS